jgi:hypothetical protein
MWRLQAILEPTPLMAELTGSLTELATTLTYQDRGMSPDLLRSGSWISIRLACNSHRYRYRGHRLVSRQEACGCHNQWCILRS